MPTPPPWCSETQVAPLAQLSSALSSGQSDTASEPSCIASVSRLGLATEPESRWSRPITIGALSSPRATISLKARPRRCALAEADPADARRQALERDALARHVEPVVQVRVVGDQLLHLGVGAVDVLRIARERRPAERADAAAEQRADIGRHEAREIEGVLHALVLRHLADVVAVVEVGTPCAWKSSIARTCSAIDAFAARSTAFGSARALGLPFGERPALRQIAVDRVVRARSGR